MRRRLLFAGVAVLVVAVAGGIVVWRAIGPPAPTAFYATPVPLGADAPGQILRSKPIQPKVKGVRLWRILYSSTDMSGDLVAVSGLLATPEGAVPDGGFPLVAVAHGTVGINRGCAPSLEPFAKVDDQHTTYGFLLGPYVEAGYAAVMTDFEGLGVEGTNSYLVGQVEGRNVLDSVRAAQDFSEVDLASGVLITGQSQGGHAALFAGQIAPAYAPELQVSGIAALAPASDLASMFLKVLEAGKRGGIVSLPVMAADAYSQTYPGVDLDKILTRRGGGALDNVIEKLCLFPAILGTQLAGPQDLIRADGLAQLDPYLDRNSPGAGPFAGPVFLGQGDADQVVPPQITRRYRDRLCAAGTFLTYQTYPGVGHFQVIDAAEKDVLRWMAAVRSGRVSTSSCAS